MERKIKSLEGCTQERAREGAYKRARQGGAQERCKILNESQLWSFSCTVDQVIP